MRNSYAWVFPSWWMCSQMGSFLDIFSLLYLWKVYNIDTIRLDAIVDKLNPQRWRCGWKFQSSNYKNVFSGTLKFSGSSSRLIKLAYTPSDCQSIVMNNKEKAPHSYLEIRKDFRCLWQEVGTKTKFSF